MNDGDDRHRQQGPQLAATLDIKELNVVSALGRGAKGVVFLARSKNGELVALKTISRSSVEKKKKKTASKDYDGSEYRRICFERDVLKCFQHPLLPKLHGVVVTEKIIGYAIDYCSGGNLYALRNKQTEQMFSADMIRFYAAELVLALEYLHGLGIVYRDLKPENVMIQENGHLMLVDFDLSTKLSAKTVKTCPSVKAALPKSEPVKKRKSSFLCRLLCDSGISPADSVHPAETDSRSLSSESESVPKSNSFVGTEYYVAPEIIRGNGHDFSVDWWCLGVVLFEMLYGRTPFRGSNRKETFYRILSMSPELVGESTPLRDLIGKLLEKDPNERISVEEIKGHDFFRGIDWEMILRVPRPPYIPVGPELEEEEDNGENKGIDVEAYVQGIFRGGDDEREGETEDNQNVANKNKGVFVEGPKQGDNFLIF